MCKVKVNWDEVEEVKNDRDNYISKKIYLKHLPKYNGGIYWKGSIGMIVPILYDGTEYMVSIDGYNAKKRHVIINIVGYFKIDYSIYTSTFLACGLGSLINNVYANPNTPNRQLIIDSIGEEEAKKITPMAHKDIDIICPNCGNKHKMSLTNLYFRDFSCPCCGDNFSYPEKLMAIILDMLNVKYSRQLRYNNGEYRYDFYLPKFNAIEETHGSQHYEGWGHNKEDLLRQQTTDKNKRYVAIHDLKVDHYDEVDCRYSTLEWCRPNIEKALSKYVDVTVLTDEDWKEADIKAQKSLVIEVCKYYNNNNNNISAIAIEFKVCRATVRRYLCKGTELGLCSYTPMETSFTSKGYVVALKNKEMVYKETSGNKLGEIISPKSPGKVGECCNYYHNPEEYMKTHKKPCKTVKGYVCMYYKDYIKQQNELNELN